MKTDQLSNQNVSRIAFSMEWKLWISLSILLLAGGLAVAKHFGDGPSQLVSGKHIHTVYLAVLVYTYGAVPVTALALIAWILLMGVWIGRQSQRTGKKIALAAVGIAFFALLWASWNTLPKFFVHYQHLTSIAVGLDDYYLGVRMALDGDDYFVVTKCPHGGLSCDSYEVAPVDQEDKTDLSTVRLEAEDANHMLVIHTATHVIPISTP